MSPRIVTVLEGESLFNDATALLRRHKRERLPIVDDEGRPSLDRPENVEAVEFLGQPDGVLEYGVPLRRLRTSLQEATMRVLQASVPGAALTMAAFGLGTLPVMLPLTWTGARMGRWLQRPALRTSVAPAGR